MTRHSLPEPTDHEYYAELAAGWALHALEPDDETQFAEHLDVCSACQSAVADYSGALAELSFLSPAVEPPPRLGDRIRTEVARDLATGGVHRAERYDDDHWTVRADPVRAFPDRSWPSQRRGGGDGDRAGGRVGRTPRWLAAAAAVVVLVLAAGNVGQYLRNQDAQRVADRQAAQFREEQREVARRGELVRLLAQPGVKVSHLNDPATGRTVAYVLLHNNNVQVLADGLERNPSTGTYVLWMAGRDGDMRAMNRFNVASAEIDLHGIGRLPSGAGGIKTFALSIEPGHGDMPADPSTGAVALGEAVT